MTWLSLEEGMPSRPDPGATSPRPGQPSSPTPGQYHRIAAADAAITQPPVMDGMLAELVNDLSWLEGDAVLLLDDMHCIRASRIHQDLVFLVDHLICTAAIRPQKQSRKNH